MLEDLEFPYDITLISSKSEHLQTEDLFNYAKQVELTTIKNKTKTTQVVPLPALIIVNHEPLEEIRVLYILEVSSSIKAL